MAKILLAEDDPQIYNNVVRWLSFERHNVEHVEDGEDAAARLDVYKFDLVILDWQLPGKSGIDICKHFRSHGGSTPIIMLTGRNALTDKEQGFDAGADDYLTKPFELRELSARIRALLRRPSVFTGTVLKVAELEIQLDTRRVLKNNQEIHLLPLEYSILEFLMRHVGQVFKPEELLDHVWGSETESSVYAVRTYIKTLRRKLGYNADNSLIQTIYGIGYKLEAPSNNA